MLDEATSNVDTASDALIQETVRAAFADCTVLTIAHRLHSIVDSDRVLVLEGGKVKEFDTPERLLQVCWLTDCGAAHVCGCCQWQMQRWRREEVRGVPQLLQCRMCCRPVCVHACQLSCVCAVWLLALHLLLPQGRLCLISSMSQSG